MNKNVKMVLIAGAAVAVVALGAYAYLVSPTKAPSASQNGNAAVNAPANDDVTAPENMPENATYTIDPARSQASFTLQEDLRGERTTVVGVTSDVSGTFEADREGLGSASIGTVRVNARTFVTDNESRNNAIRRMVLKSEDDANEFIVFRPRVVTGLPERAEIGQEFTFSTTGDLTVSGVTKEVTFTGTATFISETELEGSAQTMVHYPDFNVFVPDLPFLANVDQDVLLKLDFVATR